MTPKHRRIFGIRIFYENSIQLRNWKFDFGLEKFSKHRNLTNWSEIYFSDSIEIGNPKIAFSECFLLKLHPIENLTLKVKTFWQEKIDFSEDWFSKMGKNRFSNTETWKKSILQTRSKSKIGKSTLVIFSMIYLERFLSKFPQKPKSFGRKNSIFLKTDFQKSKFERIDRKSIFRLDVDRKWRIRLLECRFFTGSIFKIRNRT